MITVNLCFLDIDKLVFVSGRDLLISVSYIPHNTDIKLFNGVMKDILEYKQLYLVDDYNINFLNVDSRDETADNSGTIYSYGITDSKPSGRYWLDIDPTRKCRIDV